MTVYFTHRPTVIYLEKAACEYEVKMMDERNPFREMHRLAANELRLVIAESKRRAEWHGRKRRY